MHVHLPLMDGPFVPTTSLRRIIVVPRNGFANRLQAWASSAILASQLNVPLEVFWDPEPIAPTAAQALFTTSCSNATFLSNEDLRARIGADHQSLDRYLHVNEMTRVVTLAGHDLGEQHFMPYLLTTLNSACRPTTLLIIAGGKFHLPDTLNFRDLRRDFYRRLPWSPNITEKTSQIVAGRSDFIGLHIRETDRSLTAPTRPAIRRVLKELHQHTGLTSVFIAADTDTARRHWTSEVQGMGLEPWQAPKPELDRSSESAGVDALVDWRILAMANALVYSQASTFGEEAAVAGNSTAISRPLGASRTRQVQRRIASLATVAATYPRRRWS